MTSISALVDTIDESAKPDPPGPRVKSSVFRGASIFAVAFLLFGILPSRNFNYADDSLSWAYQLTRSGNLINSQHLYLNAMRWLYHLLHDAGLTIGPARLLALYSAFWGAVGLAFLYRLLVRTGFGDLALWGTLFCAFAADYWSYSIVGDVYIPQIGLMMMGLYFVYFGITSENARIACRYALGATMTFLLMLVHHQAFILFVLGLLPAAFLMQKATVRWRVLFGVGVPGAVSALAFLLWTAVYYSMVPVKERDGLIKFGMGYVASFQDRPDQKHLGLKTMVNLAAGELRALISTNMMFKSDAVAQSIQHRYPSRAVYPLPYLVRDIPAPVAVLLGICAVAAALLVTILFVRGLWAGLKERGLILLIVVPMVPQVLFFAWWEAISDEFAVWTLPLLAIIVARGSAEMSHPLRWARTTVACLLLSTSLGSIFLYWNPRNDIDWVNDQYVNSFAKDDFLLGFEDIQSDSRIAIEADKRGFKYFNIRAYQGGDAKTQAEAALDSAVSKGARIHVSPKFTYPPKSALAFIATFNPNFNSQRAAVLAKLRAMPAVDWVEPAVLERQYFQVDEGASAPR